jgi:hypothetical protein
MVDWFSCRPSIAVWRSLALMIVAFVVMLQLPAPAAATHYDDTFNSDPLTFSCGYFVQTEICGSYGLFSGGHRILNSGDTLTERVSFTSPVNVPGSATTNVFYLALPDIRSAGGIALPGGNTAIVTTIPTGFVGLGVPITGPYTAANLNEYLAITGFCCGLNTPNAGFSLIGATIDFAITSSDPAPIYGAAFGYSLDIGATPTLLTDIVGGTVGHPVLLPPGMLTGQITSNISGGSAPSEEFYKFSWAGGLFQTTGTIAGANPAASFAFQLVDPFTSLTITGLSLDAGNAFTGLLTYNLAAGSYEIGLRTTSPFDPRFTIHFNTPVTGSVPEPTQWALLIAGFGLVGAVQRSRRSVLDVSDFT